MSRQRAGWGFTRAMERLLMAVKPKSETAGKNKYPTPHGSNGEMIRRMRQMEKLAEKASKRKGEVNESRTI